MAEGGKGGSGRIFFRCMYLLKKHGIFKSSIDLKKHPPSLPPFYLNYNRA